MTSIRCVVNKFLRDNDKVLGRQGKLSVQFSLWLDRDVVNRGVVPALSLLSTNLRNLICWLISGSHMMIASQKDIRFFAVLAGLLHRCRLSLLSLFLSIDRWSLLLRFFLTFTAPFGVLLNLVAIYKLFLLLKHNGLPGLDKLFFASPFCLSHEDAVHSVSHALMSHEILLGAKVNDSGQVCTFTWQRALVHLSDCRFFLIRVELSTTSTCRRWTMLCTIASYEWAQLGALN